MVIIVDYFEGKGLAWELDLRRKLMNMKMKEGEKVGSYIHSFEYILRQLEKNRNYMKESDKICRLLMILPESYETLIKVFINLPKELQTYKSLKKRIRNEEKRRDLSYRNRDDVTGNETVLQMSKVKCYKCGQCGHVKRYCNVHDNNTSESVINFRENMFNLTSNRFNNLNDSRGQCITTNKGGRIEFVVDSVAPYHMVNNKLYFSEYVTLNDPMKLIIAKDNENVMAVGKGTVEVLSIVNNQKQRISLKNVLHIPDLRCNLLSVKRMANFGLRVVFQYNKVEVYKSEECLAVGKGLNLFKVSFKLMNE